MAFLGLTAVCASCRGSAQGDCEKAVAKVWHAADIDPYFSAIPLQDAVRACRAHGVDSIPIDRGWHSGLHCYSAEDDGWSRCERSNRECEYYRRVAQRARRKVSRCTKLDKAWAIIFKGDPVNPQPSPEACAQVRADLIASGKLGEGDLCQETDYARLLLGRRRFIPAAVTE